MSTSLQEKSKHKKKSSFFSELSPHIEYASKYDRELNRRVAHKFNVFDFLDKKEIGLSKIIAHLFNPSASHGQGTIFLQHFLKLVTNEENNWNHLDSENVKVDPTEHTTDEGRRIDIYVEILGEIPFVLAIENKPRARDRENQVLDYLKYLDKKTGDFLLVYISRNGKGPSERSLPRENRGEWEEKFKVMAYAKSDKVTADESFDFQRVDEPLTTWFKICKKECDVDRLRWFLGDAENFCTKSFGDSNSTDDVEVLIVKKFLLEKDNQKYLDTAYAVKKAWPNVVNEIAGEFFRFLTEAIEYKIREEFAERNDFQISSEFDFDGNEYIFLRLYSENWIEYEIPDNSNDTHGRYCIVFINEKKNRPDGWYGWYVGVESPKKKKHMEHDEQSRFEKIKRTLEALKIPNLIVEDDDSCPGYIYAEDDKQYWEQFLKKLLDETEQKKGEISDYYVRLFCKFADKAIRVLDVIENHR